VSILSGLKRAVAGGHLDDDAFAEIWSDAVASGQPGTHAHLAECPQCRSRYAAFTGWLDRIQDDARAEVDEIFSPERLAVQQAQVMRRLEAIERPARVIAFPRFARPVSGAQSHAQRWVAGAAAAGLLIGLAAGQFVDIRDALGGRRRPIETATQFSSSRATNVHLPAPAVQPISATSVSDEQIFFGDAEQGVRLSTLRPMDDITPRMRDERP
jgi:hypothetical protein